eukprot:11514584-Alexandrium_andersonii.AAC.1
MELVEESGRPKNPLMEIDSWSLGAIVEECMRDKHFRVDPACLGNALVALTGGRGVSEAVRNARLDAIAVEWKECSANHAEASIPNLNCVALRCAKTADYPELLHAKASPRKKFGRFLAQA